MNKIQILYPLDLNGRIVKAFVEEAKHMEKKGFLTGGEIINEAERVIYRGFTIYTAEQYPQSQKLIQGWEENRKTLFMDIFYPLIKSNTIPTEFINKLSEEAVLKIAKKNDWKRVFIKSVSRSLFCIDDYSSVWPDTPIKKMIELYKELKINGPFAIREFIDNPQIFYNEQRYWVLKGKTYHQSGFVPDFVQKVGMRIFENFGSNYFTIDVAGNYIIEINPGESSDRGGDFPLDFLCKIFAETFLFN